MFDSQFGLGQTSLPTDISENKGWNYNQIKPTKAKIMSFKQSENLEEHQAAVSYKYPGLSPSYKGISGRANLKSAQANYNVSPSNFAQMKQMSQLRKTQNLASSESQF